MPERIQRRSKGWSMPFNAVYVGSGTAFANPYRIYRHSGTGKNTSWGVEDTGRLHTPCGHGWTKVGAATAATIMYQKLFDEVYPPKSAARYVLAESLRGKDLVCWCPLEDDNGEPFPCHADILLQASTEIMQ